MNAIERCPVLVLVAGLCVGGAAGCSSGFTNGAGGAASTGAGGATANGATSTASGSGTTAGPASSAIATASGTSTGGAGSGTTSSEASATTASSADSASSASSTSAGTASAASTTGSASSTTGTGGAGSSGATTSSTMTGGGCAGGVMACTTPASCPAETTDCATNTCVDGCCGITAVAKGTDCSDSGGSVCNGSGQCVPPTCSDGIRDGNETDVDCGGDCTSTANGGKTCPNGEGCSLADDCTSQVCDNSFHCNTLGNGLGCSLAVECTSLHCLRKVGSSGDICCATACDDMGAASCGNDGQCAPGGASCAKYPSGTPCASATCTGNIQYGASSCDGDGSCVPSAATPCPNHFACAAPSGGTACASVCSGTGTDGCAPNYACNGSGACLLAGGQPCTLPSDCASNACASLDGGAPECL